MEKVEIDLSLGGKLTVVQSKRLTELEPVIRDEYTNFIGALAQTNSVAGETWLLGTLCRNPFVSGILERFLRFALLDDLLKTGSKNIEVVCDSAAVAHVAEAILDQYVGKSRIRIFSKPKEKRLLIRFSQSLFSVLNKYLWPRLTRPRKIRMKGPLMLVETMINAKQMIAQGIFVDSYFPNLFELGTRNNIEMQLCYLVLAVSELRTFSDHRKFWQTLRRSKSRVIVKEEYLRLKDYCWALANSFSIPYRITKVPRWRQYDVSLLVISEVRSNIGNRALVEALLAYRFFFSIKSAGVAIDGIIDWNENQVIDRALCLGIRENYPGARVKGYQGFFVPEFYLNHDITAYERAAGTTPDEIMVISPLLVEQKKRYCPDLKVTTAPAFRFVVHPTSGENKENILIGLPVHVKDSEQILTMLVGLPREMKGITRIRPHPDTNRAELDDMLHNTGLSKEGIDISCNLLSEQLDSTVLLISAGSSLCAEAVSAGARVAILGNRNGITMNPLRGRISDAWWKVCYSTAEIVEFYYSPAGVTGIPEEKLFVPVTKKNVTKMLRLG